MSKNIFKSLLFLGVSFFYACSGELGVDGKNGGKNEKWEVSSFANNWSVENQPLLLRGDYSIKDGNMGAGVYDAVLGNKTLKFRVFKDGTLELISYRPYEEISYRPYEEEISVFLYKDVSKVIKLGDDLKISLWLLTESKSTTIVTYRISESQGYQYSLSVYSNDPMIKSGNVSLENRP